MRRLTGIIAMAFTLVAMLVLLASNAYGQSDENTVEFWCDNGEKFEPVETPFIVPDPPEGTTWTLLVLKAGTENHSISTPTPGSAYSHPSGKEISHVILCYEESGTTTTVVPPTTTDTTTSTTALSTTTTTVPPVITVPPATTTTTEQRYLCEDGEVVAIGPEHPYWEGASFHPGDPVCELSPPPVGGVPAGGGSTAYSQFPAVEIAIIATAWFLVSALAVAAYAMIRKGDQ